MEDKSDLYQDRIEAVEYQLDGAVVVQIVFSLLNLVLSFVTAKEAKGLIDRLTADQAQEAAEAAERRKFGSD
jgi:hypothetical protein